MRLTLKPRTCQVIERNIMIARHLKDIRFLLRLQSILLWSNDEELEKIAKICLTSERTIYNWRNLFIYKRVDGLRYKKSHGRKNKLNTVQKKELKTIILEGPEASGYKTGIWTSALIQELIYKKFDVQYSLGYISQLLNQINLSHKKVETFCYKGNPEEQRKWKQETFPELLKKVKLENASLLFQDEATFKLWTGKAYSWGEKGKKIKAKISMDREYRILIGSIDLQTGKLTCSKVKEFNNVAYVNYLRYLLTRYQNKKIYLVTDGSPIHKAGAVNKFLEKNKEFIELVKLPAYSPQFNPIEKIWKKIKQKFTHNRCFKTINDLEHALRLALIDFYDNKEKVLSVMKKYRNIYDNAITTFC